MLGSRRAPNICVCVFFELDCSENAGSTIPPAAPMKSSFLNFLERAVASSRQLKALVMIGPRPRSLQAKYHITKRGIRMVFANAPP